MKLMKHIKIKSPELTITSGKHISVLFQSINQYTFCSESNSNKEHQNMLTAINDQDSKLICYLAIRISSGEAADTTLT